MNSATLKETCREINQKLLNRRIKERRLPQYKPLYVFYSVLDSLIRCFTLDK